MSVYSSPSHLSSEAAEYLNNPAELPAIDYSDHAGLAVLREQVHAEWMLANEQLTEPWVSRDDTVADVPVVWFARNESDFANNKVIVHMHGGSYWCGSPMTNASLVVPVAQRTGLPVASIDYRLAPEHPFPAGVDDCLAVASALTETHMVAAMYGESAGGGLALTTALGLRDARLPLPERLGLLSPWTDMTISGDSYKTNFGIDPDFPHADEPTQTAAMYAGDSCDDLRASPLFADHAGLPPTLIQVGGREILLSDSTRLAAAMRQTGVDVTLDVWDGLWHVWQLWHQLPETTQAFDELAAFLVPEA